MKAGKLYILPGILLALIAVLFIAVRTTRAEVAKSQQLVCLNVEWCNDEKSQCANGRNGHRVRLTAKPDSPPLPKADTFIIECVSTATGEICTTGNADNHADIQWPTSLSELQTAVGYNFLGLFAGDGNTRLTNPIKSSNTGEIGPIEWESSTPQGTFRKFLALNFFEPEIVTGNEGGQQQATFELQAAADDCTSVRWDPYGIVFDSQSLEPIPGTQITLLERGSSGAFTEVNVAGLTNPITTKADGVYNFVVQDGVYKLDVTNGSYNALPANFATIHPNYTKIYSDLYPFVGNDVYNPNAYPTAPMVNQGSVEQFLTRVEASMDSIDPSDFSIDADILSTTSGDQQINYEIKQVGGVQAHRDIPLDPKSGAGQKYPLKVIDYYEHLQKFNNVLVIEGRVSHPYTRVTAYTVLGSTNNRNRTLDLKVQASKLGMFKIEIDQTAFSPGERFGGLDFEKIDLTQDLSKKTVFDTIVSFLQRLIKPVDAQTVNPNKTSIAIDPVLNYIEGYAYDSKGAILADTTVGVYLPFSRVAFYETTTDKDGYFKISSEFLPFMPYKLRYNTSSGVTTEITTSRFLEQNAKYIEANNINLYAYKNAKGQVITAPVTEPTKAPENPNPILERASQPGTFAAVVVILLILGAGGTIIGLRMMKKKK